MSAIEIMCEHKSNDREQPSLDALSHTLRTPLHAISHHVHLLQSSSDRLDQIRAKLKGSEPNEWQQKLRETAVFLKKKLQRIQASLGGLENFVASGDYETLFQGLKRAQDIAISPLSEFVERQANITMSYNALLELQKALDTLSTTEAVEKDVLEMRLKEIATGLKTHLTQMTATLNGLVSAGWRHTVTAGSYYVETADAAEKVLRALVVDDTSINRKMLAKVLEKEGFVCEFAEDGAKAVEKYAPEKYDVIFMDITMPVMDGYEATQAIRKQEQTMACHATPIIAVTAIAPTAENADKIEKAGMDSFISKPFKAEHLKGLIKQYALKQPASPLSSDVDDSEHPLPPPLALKSVSAAVSSATLLPARGSMMTASVPASNTSASTAVEGADDFASPLTAARLMSTLGFMAHKASLTEAPTPAMPHPALTIHLNVATSVF